MNELGTILGRAMLDLHEKPIALVANKPVPMDLVETPVVLLMIVAAINLMLNNFGIVVVRVVVGPHGIAAVLVDDVVVVPVSHWIDLPGVAGSFDQRILDNVCELVCRHVLN